MYDASFYLQLLIQINSFNHDPKDAHLIFFFKLSDHNNSWHFVLPDHLPKVIDCVSERTYGNNSQWEYVTVKQIDNTRTAIANESNLE